MIFATQRIIFRKQDKFNR